jgi:hypothetical protein
MKARAVVLGAMLALAAAALVSRDPERDAGLAKAFRRPVENGWIFVHLEGSPADIGYLMRNQFRGIGLPAKASSISLAGGVFARHRFPPMDVVSGAPMKDRV